MTIPMPIRESIRVLDAAGTPARQIAKRLGIARNTVAKYAGQEDFSPSPNLYSPHSLVDDYAHIVESWLINDLQQSPKQRHTGRRVFDRLVAEHHFQGSYSTVQRWVKRWHEARNITGEGFSELEWMPGSAQVDFGEADVFLKGVRTRVHVLVVTYPFSNGRYAVALPGETAECVCQGLRTVFEHVGRAPNRIVFDNATGVGKRFRNGSVTTTKLFEAFRLHYRLEATFTSPNAGNEKGSVENAVGFIRRNCLVPVPHVESLEGLTTILLNACDRMFQFEHYRKKVTLATLFEKDLEAMRHLPGIGFDACSWLMRRVDLVGNVSVKETKYYVGSEYSGQQIHVGTRAFTIEALTLDGQPIIEHDRIYGAHEHTVTFPIQLLPALQHKPGAIRNSPLRKHLPDVLLGLFDAADQKEKRRLLEMLQHVSEQAGFDATIEVMTGIAEDGRNLEPSEVEMGAKRASEQPPETRNRANLRVYDQFTRKVTS